MTVTMRRATAEDEAFLRGLIQATVARQLHADLWPPEIRETLLGMQCDIRRNGSMNQYSGAESRIVTADEAAAGWMVVAELPHEVRIAEIMVSHELRGRGIGSAAIRAVIEEARSVGKPCRLSVSTGNPEAARLYERLGFRRLEGDETDITLEHGGDPA